MWFCGGHGVCTVDSDGDGGRDRRTRRTSTIASFSGSTATSRARTGSAPAPRSNGSTRTAGGTVAPAATRSKPAGHLKGSSDGGTVPLMPGINPTSGVLVFASPDPLAPVTGAASSRRAARRSSARRRFASHTPRSAPRRRARTASPTSTARSWIKERNVVVGNQATPIPIKLDGEEHTIRAQLTRIANVAPEAGFRTTAHRPVGPIRYAARSGRGDDLRPRSAPADHQAALALTEPQPRRRSASSAASASLTTFSPKARTGRPPCRRTGRPSSGHRRPRG